MLRAFWPTIFFLICSAIAMVMLTKAADSQYTRGIFEMLWWLPFVGIAAAAIHCGYVIFRVWQAESGEGPICGRCGGPLGIEKDGRYGEYRTCISCGKYVSNRNY